MLPATTTYAIPIRLNPRSLCITQKCSLSPLLKKECSADQKMIPSRNEPKVSPANGTEMHWAPMYTNRACNVPSSSISNYISDTS